MKIGDIIKVDEGEFAKITDIEGERIGYKLLMLANEYESNLPRWDFEVYCDEFDSFNKRWCLKDNLIHYTKEEYQMKFINTEYTRNRLKLWKESPNKFYDFFNKLKFIQKMYWKNKHDIVKQYIEWLKEDYDNDYVDWFLNFHNIK